ncbi:hypothetical protein HQ305_06710 [Rhodococcus sp. BP-149]|uniref:DUF6412 domain-containing protein n=1 Tax=unclassified Rhodococcus (in: high G+C Gram-positive bacteria) TaxID=192944 RepID=UPI001D6049F7|nr:MULTISPECIES: DUF6412 domain-containing protein [unclassified Rhodococcus (in: high G+C Gram-positive bacteria)]MBY6684005.1 hypothetical protein [Rhodococcus sp. BP-288]MBY6693334.1 hypothetical protein [Rhodococcus sp. BP-188]MBY6697531.1 hypothetical protein [Rhodococcus sp. BP-285]MBY6702208.1 hypothetical protein [Rhodococcus sp. BP-283]MBY6706513.1 hypothetical protein [Rhodococcus sp. BP-241]
MRSGSVHLSRLTVALMMLSLGLVLIVAMPQPIEVAVAVAVTVSAALIAVVFLRPGPLIDVASAGGPPADERRLRGSFRRQSHPATPGRPMPRAPGALAEAQPN